MLKFQKLAIATMAVLALTACSKKEKAAAPETKNRRLDLHIYQ